MITKKVTYVFLITSIQATLSLAQIMRDTPPSGGSPTRGSNYSDRNTVGQPSSPSTSPRPASRQPSPGRGCNFSCISEVSSDESEVTTTGIALDKVWKKKLYEFSKKNVIHSAWGMTHSERNFHLTKDILNHQNLTFDEDVLFAASFLHDLGGLEKFKKEGVDHGVQSAFLAEGLLRSFGFPENKIESVKEVVKGHVYSKEKPKSDLALAFRDADMLDFLGVNGVARMLSATSEWGGNIHQVVDIIQKLKNQIATQFTFEWSQSIAQKKIKEQDYFLEILKKESLNGLAY